MPGGGSTSAVPLSSTRTPVGFVEVPALLTTNSKVFTPLMKPLSIENGSKAPKLPLWVKPVALPLSRIAVPTLSLDHWPVITAVSGLRPSRSKRIR